MRLLRRSVVGIPALALGLTLPPQVAAFAQTRTGEDVQKLEAITVTGSRIKKAEAEGQTPVITISAKDIASTGLGRPSSSSCRSAARR